MPEPFVPIDLYALMPEITLFIGLLLLLPLDILFKNNRYLYLCATIACIVALVLCLFQWHTLHAPQSLFSGHMDFHPTGRLLNACMLAAATLSLTSFGRALPHSAQPLGVVSFLLLVIGSLFLTAAKSMISLYVAIELTAIPAYILCMSSPHPHAKQIAFRYMIWGLLSSATMLFGASIWYAKTQQLFFQVPPHAPYAFFWVWLFIAALSFKMALFPLQRWVTEVYSLLPIPFLSYLATAVKIAACVAMARIAFALQDLNAHIWLWSALAVLSYTYGNIAALRAQNLRTLLAYSTIAYGGFLMIPMIQPNKSIPLLFITFGFYLIAHYILFAILYQLEKYPIHSFDEYPSIPHRHRIFMSLPFALALIALIGLPPTLGFSAKWFILTSLWTHATHNIEYIVVGLALVNTLLAVFYYLKPIFAMHRPLHRHLNTSLSFGVIELRAKLLWMVLALALVVGFGYAGYFLQSLASTSFFE